MNPTRSALAASVYAQLPVFAQNWACTFAGWQRARARFTPHFHATLSQWEASLSLADEELVRIQWQRLRRLLEHSRQNVPHYADLPPAVEHADPREALTRSLARIPPLEKSTYRDATQTLLARNLPREQLIRGKTSGTTGSALALWWTQEALAEEFAAIWRARRQHGVAIRDANLTFNGQIVVPWSQQTPPYWRRNGWNGQTLFSLYHCSPENLQHYVEAVHETPALYAQGYPSSLHLVARALLDAGRPLAPGRLRACFTSSESLLAFQREAIEAAFGAPVRDRYGVSEFCVSMNECPQGRLHVDMEFGIVEVEVEEECDEWQRGPLLVTGFANDATPLIRYRVGDVGTRSRRPCPCGRAGDVFLDVDGRIEDYVRTPDGRLVGRLDHVFKEQLDVAEAQILQQAAEAIEVRVVRRPSYDQASERGLLKEFRSRLGDAIEIDLRYVDSIPRESNGKFRAVKSKVGRLNP